MAALAPARTFTSLLLQQKSPKTFTKMFPKLSKLSVSINFDEKVVGKNSGGI